MGMFRDMDLLGVISLALALAASASVAAGPAYDGLVVFGDSLSDSGNAGRFSNGPVWVERLAERLGLALRPSRTGGRNFAVGGARLDPHSGPDSLRAQADRFLAEPRPGGRTLYIVYGGGNDLLAAMGAGDAEAGIAIDRAVRALGSIVADLVAHGAADILVPNLPDIGMTPALRAAGSEALARATALTDGFNAAVDRALANFGAAPGLRLYRFDVRALAERARADPQAFGFVDITTPCAALPSCEGYLFWDRIHPTKAAHAHLAEAAFRMLRGEAAHPSGDAPSSGPR